MANPQPDEFTRISNELFEAIILAGFKKRQLNIILLVIRLSYGCGRKYAVLRQADFQVIGIDKSDIKKELLLLVECGVLTVNGERVALNKDYDRWRIPRARPAGPERFKQILKRNLAEKAAGAAPAGAGTGTGTPPAGAGAAVGVSPTTPAGPDGKTPPGPGGKVGNSPTTPANWVGKSPGAETAVGNSPTIPAGPVGKTPTFIAEPVGKTPTIPAGLVGKSPTLTGPVGKTPTTELVKYQPKCWQNTNSGVGKTPTLQTPQAKGGKGPGGAERNIKETLKKSKEKETCAYDPHFEKFWAVYPRKVEKQRAYRCWKIRIREGLSEGLTTEGLVGDLVNAAANYAAECRRQGTQQRYIKHAATFLGPDKPYLDWINAPRDGQENRPVNRQDEKKELIRSLYMS
jgi:hypothetical protein